jgi:hypothetical protein
MSPSVLNPKNAEANAKLSRDPALRARVTVRPQASCRLAPEPDRVTGAATGEPEPRVTTADVLEALHRATGLPIVADYYTRLFLPANLSVQGVPVFDALNTLADGMRLRWNRDGEWLQLRSTSYFHDRLKEVPNSLLARWAESRRRHGALTLDDLIEIAGLTDAQLDASGMAEGARACFGLEEWAVPRWRALRSQLRYLATFTPTQRQEAQRPEGLRFTRMTLAQQQGYLSRAFHDRQTPRLDRLSEATLHVDYTVPGVFRWSPPGRAWRPSPVREKTREAALAAARRLDPQVEAAHITPTRLDLFVLFTPDPGGGTVRMVCMTQDGWGPMR